MALNLVPRRLDNVTLVDAVLVNRLDVERTFYKDIRRLPPAHMLTIRAGEPPQLNRYWQLPADGQELQGSAAEFAGEFRERFEVAVRRRLAAPTNLGAQLSGGLDSSSVTVMARHLMPPDHALRTYTAVFDNLPECDERPYAQAVTNRGFYTPTYVHGDVVGPLAFGRRLSEHLDEPVMAGNLGLNHMMARQAAAVGVEVMLDGFDGDTTVSHGRRRLQELAQQGRVFDLARQSRGFAATFHSSALEIFGAYFRTHLVERKLARVRGGRRVTNLAKRLARRRSGAASENQSDIFLSGYLDRVEEERSAGGAGARPPRTATTSERQEHVGLLNQWYMTQTLEVLDATTGAFGIQPRYPFFDQDLIEYCVSLPAVAKLDRGWSRLVMRDALEGLLPPEVQWRRDKSNLAPSFVNGLLGLDRPLLQEALSLEALAEFMDLSVLQQQYARIADAFDRTGPGGVDTNVAGRLFRVASAARWLADTGL